MSIIPVAGYTVQCDHCKKTSADDSDYTGWTEEDAAWGEAIEEDWTEDGIFHYCPDCLSYDDDDNIVLRELPID